ncbi:MAG: chemotaxis protein CheC [Anaerolineae bacterium]|nr:chemotaxis protein CheC [Anaerolineae bacterium]
MKRRSSLWDDIVADPHGETRLATIQEYVTYKLSSLAGRQFHHQVTPIQTIPLTEITTHAGDPEARMVGIYLQIHGDMEGQSILLLSPQNALTLASWMMDEMPRELGLIERSALGEAGNIVLSGFLNAMARVARIPQRIFPSPPAVMVDMLGAILSLLVVPVSTKNDELMIIETIFDTSDHAVQIRFWILPDLLAG